MAQTSQDQKVPPRTPRVYDPAKHCGHPRRNGNGPCTQKKGFKTQHVGFGFCASHGGNTKAKATHAAKEMAASLAYTYGAPVGITPIDAILDEIYRANGHVAWLYLQIQLLEPSALTWSRSKLKSGTTPQGDIHVKEYASNLHGLLQAYWEERDRRLTAAKAALALGIAQRQLDLAQHQAEQLTGELWRLVQDLQSALGLEDQGFQTVRSLVGAMLRRLAEAETATANRTLSIEGGTAL